MLKNGWCVTREYADGRAAIVSRHRTLEVAESIYDRICRDHPWCKKGQHSYNIRELVGGRLGRTTCEIFSVPGHAQEQRDLLAKEYRLTRKRKDAATKP